MRRTGYNRKFLWGTRWRLEWEPRDLRIGVFWKCEPCVFQTEATALRGTRTDIYICPLPTLVVHWWWRR